MLMAGNEKEEVGENGKEQSVAAAAKYVFAVEPNLLPGEIILAKVEEVKLHDPFTVGREAPCTGTLFVTNFKISFQRLERSSYGLTEPGLPHPDQDDCQSNEIPLTTVYKVYARKPRRPFTSLAAKRRLLIPHHSIKNNVTELEFLCKDFRRIIFSFQGCQPSSVLSLVNSILVYSFPRSITQFFAFDTGKVLAKTNRKAVSLPLFNCVADWEKELNRLNAAKQWRVSTNNGDFSVSEGLPSCFPCPTTVSDKELVATANCYVNGRLPLWAWTHPVTGVALCTSSVVRRDIAELDKSMEKALSNMTCGDDRCVHMLDLDQTCAGREEIETSFTRLRSICTPASLHDWDATDSQYLSGVQSSEWMKHVRQTLIVATEVTRVLCDDKVSIILEDSEGRLSVCLISSLVQLLVDPHYRTLAGFQHLVQKSWIAHGHPFLIRTRSKLHDLPSPDANDVVRKSTRRFWSRSPVELSEPGDRKRTLSSQGSKTGTLSSRSNDGGSPSTAEVDLNTTEHGYFNPCPIFLLFLDCVWQILQQFPSAFQFTSFYLEQIWMQVFSSQHGSFLFSGEHHKQQIMGRVGSEATLLTIWDVLRLRPLLEKVCYVNPLFRLGSAISRRSSLRSQADIASEELAKSGHAYKLRCHKMAAGFSTSHLSAGKTKESRFLHPATNMACLQVWVDRYLQFSSVATLAEGGAISVASRQAEMVRLVMSRGAPSAHLLAHAEVARRPTITVIPDPNGKTTGKETCPLSLSSARHELQGSDVEERKEMHRKRIIDSEDDDLLSIESLKTDESMAEDMDSDMCDSDVASTGKALEHANPTASMKRASSLRQTQQRLVALNLAATEIRNTSPETASTMGLAKQQSVDKVPGLATSC